MLEEPTASCLVIEEIEEVGSSKFLPDSTGGAGRATHAGQILNEILEKALQVWGWAWD